MRKVCQQSRRWHQQLSLITNHSGRRRLVQQLWLPTRYQQRHYAKDQNDDLVVREYEQLGSDKKTRVAVDPQAELEQTGEYLKSEIDRLDKELAVLKEGPFGPNSEFMQSLSPDDRKIALEALQREGAALQDGLTDADLAELDRIVEDQDEETEEADHRPAPQIPLNHPREHQVYIRILNAALKDMMIGSPSKAKKAAVWKSYQRCLQHIPQFPSLLSAEVWDMLWQTQMEESDNSRSVIELARNMRSLSLPLAPEKELLYIESLRKVGEMSAAIEVWRENRSILGPKEEFARRFWELGVQLYSENGEPDKAENIATQCLHHGSIASATILVPVIESWARQNAPGDLEKAWACYLRFKVQLQTGIEAKDYETISTTFLRQGHPQMALNVFKDMVLDWGPQKHADYDSVSAYRRLAGLVQDVQSNAINEDEVNRVSLSALIVLPRVLQNEFFYASWLKRLIGLMDLDSAAKVIELMYERGLKPHAKHVNGMIGAWLRDKSSSSRHRAEQTAWAMINRRIDFVHMRREKLRAPEGIWHLGDVRTPVFIKRPLPVATIETFSILLVHYTRRCQDDKARQLMEIMTKRAMIEPNSFILNHWLYASLRAKDLESVWSQYQNTVGKITADLETFACLWDTARVQWDPTRSTHWNGFPSARELLREMNSWAAQIRVSQLNRAKKEFSAELYNQIIRVFCFRHDLRGTLCALHGLKQLFGKFPDGMTSRLITIQIARLLPNDPGRRIPRRRRSTTRPLSGMTASLTTIDEVMQTLTDLHVISLMDAGLDPHNLDDAVSKQMRLDVLSDLLIVVLKKQATSGREVENEVRQTAIKMGFVLDGVDFRKDEKFALDGIDIAKEEYVDG